MISKYIIKYINSEMLGRSSSLFIFIFIFILVLVLGQGMNKYSHTPHALKKQFLDHDYRSTCTKHTTVKVLHYDRFSEIVLINISILIQHHRESMIQVHQKYSIK